MPTLKVREILKILRKDGWYLDRYRGSHRQFKHMEKPGAVTVSGKPSDDIHSRMVAAIMGSARISKDRYEKR